MFIMEWTALSRARTRKFLRNLGLSSGKSNKSVVYHEGLEYSSYPIISLLVGKEEISSAQKRKKTSSGNSVQEAGRAAALYHLYM